MSAASAPRDFTFAIAIGPVGRFIGGGRRSRDLWYGSRFLSEVTRCVANHLAMNRATLVVPTKSRIEKSFFPAYQGPTISNKVLGVMHRATPQELRDALGAARGAAQSFLVQQLEILLKCPSCTRDGVVIAERVNAEIEAVKRGDFIEYYAAYAQGNDSSALKKAMYLLAARKNTRAFGAPFGAEGAPKSSLDPGRDSVLDEANPRTSRGRRLALARRRLGIEGQERLDAISVARRLAAFDTGREGEVNLPKLPFPPLARVVLAPWLEGAKRTSADRLAALREALRGLDKDALCLFSSPCREPGGNPATPLFDYDPSLFLENGIESLQRALKPKRQVGQLFPERTSQGNQDEMSPEEQDNHVQAAARFLTEHARAVRELLARVGTPQPYYALLEADGDGIGSLLDTADPEQRDALVGALYGFADDSWKCVESHDGCAFYAGADELVAYLPVDRSLEAARALMELFHEKLAPRGGAEPPSLSVGVAIAHLKDDLRATRARAKGALKRAKQLRRARRSNVGWICVQEVPRGGSERFSAGEGRFGDDDFVVRVRGWQGALNNEHLSMKTAHDLIDLAVRFDRGDDSPIGLDLAKSLIRYKPRRSGAYLSAEGGDVFSKLEEQSRRWQCWDDVRRFANEVLLAERINRVHAQRHLDVRPAQVVEENL